MSQSESFSYMRVLFCLNCVTVRLLVIVPVFSDTLFWKLGVVLVVVRHWHLYRSDGEI